VDSASGTERMDKFKQIDPSQVDFSNGRLARKYARVRAWQATREEEIASEMQDGFRETTNTARPGDYIVENPDGERYVMSADDFQPRYRPTDQESVYEPASEPVRVVELKEDVRFEAPWGEEMRIRAGGFLISNSPDDIYGIQADEFAKTYTYVD